MSQRIAKLISKEKYDDIIKEGLQNQVNEEDKEELFYTCTFSHQVEHQKKLIAILFPDKNSTIPMQLAGSADNQEIIEWLKKQGYNGNVVIRKKEWKMTEWATETMERWNKFIYHLENKKITLYFLLIFFGTKKSNLSPFNPETSANDDP